MVFRPLLNAALVVVAVSSSFFQLSSVFPFASAFSSSALPPQQKQPLPKNLPRSPNDVVRQAANSITKAYECGIYLQTIRLPLSEAIYGDKEEGFVAMLSFFLQSAVAPVIFCSQMLHFLLHNDNDFKK